MKIAFLISNVHDMGGTAGAVVAQANALCADHDVQVLSVYRTDDPHHFPLDPRVQVRDLVLLTGRDEAAEARVDVLSPEQATGLIGVDPLLIDPLDDPGLDALADVGLESALPSLDADVLVTLTPALLSYAVQLAPTRTAIVHQEHRSSSQRAASRALLLDRARRADVVAMLTESMATWLAEEMGSAAPKIVVVPNAVPPGFRPRSLLSEPVILSAGRMASEKQWPQLIAGFGLVADQIPDWRVRIFGDGPARFEAMGMVRKLGLWDRVELPGPTSDLGSEWARASISAVTSRSEAFPLVIQESMAAGVPVVAYDMPSGAREQIDDGVDGLLVAQGSEAGLAAALLRLATDPAERTRMGAAALTKAATWDSPTITARWVEIYEDAVRRRGPASVGRSTTLLPRRAAAAEAATSPAEAPTELLTPTEARAGALDVIARVASGLGTLWWVVPPHAGSAPVVVMPMAARRDFLRALADELPAYLSLHDPEFRGWPSRRGTPRDMMPSLLRGRTSRLLIEPWPATGEVASLVERGCEVVVEFWEEGPGGDLHASGGATYTTVMSPDVDLVTASVLGVDVPTHPLMLVPTPYDCTFEVDVVYTWVDGSDEDWNRAREARLAAVADPSMLTRAASGRARYVDRGELRYSLRGLHLFAPWVRRIHVVTAGQVPIWLDPTHPRINLVDHRDLLPADALPTFNSHAIESVIHRIDGLAEHFVYFNDDVFLGTPTHPERFFSPAGATAVFPSSTLVGLPGQDDLPYLKAATNNRRLLQDAFGVATVNTLAHTPHPHRRSVLTEIASRFAPEVEATTRAPFRSSTDLSMLSSLAQHYGLITGTAYAAESDYAFVDITDALVRRRLDDLLRRERVGFCLGDGHAFARDPELVASLVAEFLDAYFPIPAPWER